MKRATNLLCCDFCQKHQHEVSKLIMGPREIAICSECVALCVEIIDEEAVKDGQASTAAAPPSSWIGLAGAALHGAGAVIGLVLRYRAAAAGQRQLQVELEKERGDA